jgi:hypothetical protein
MCSAGAMNELVKEMNKYRVDVCAVREVSLPGKGTAIDREYMIVYSGCKMNKQEFGTGFYIGRYIMDNLLDFERVNEKICKIWVKIKY